MKEIFDFSQLTFQEIPEESNPAFKPNTDCLMIVKRIRQVAPYVNAGRICVLRIDPMENPKEEESVTQLGLFWELSHAKLFAEAFIQNSIHNS